VSKIIRVKLYSEVIEALRTYIEEHNLSKGDKLPSQAELTKLLNVSKGTLREALRDLEDKGVVEVVNGMGIYVVDKNPDMITAQIEFRREKESILELMEVRRVLETEIVHLVIRHATDEELDEVEKWLRILMEKYHRGVKQNKEDRAFHLAIYRCCHNKVMQQVILSIEDLLSKLWEFPLGLKDPFTTTIPYHENLFRALRNRDIKEAQYFNDKILQMVCEEVREAL